MMDCYVKMYKVYKKKKKTISCYISISGNAVSTDIIVPIIVLFFCFLNIALILKGLTKNK